MLLLAAHVLPDPLWYDPNADELDGTVIVIIPDASKTDLESSIDVNNEEKVRLEKELVDCVISTESSEVKEEDAEVKFEVNVEEEDEAFDLIWSQCGVEFKSDVALGKHNV